MTYNEMTMRHHDAQVLHETLQAKCDAKLDQPIRAAHSPAMPAFWRPVASA